MMTTHTPKESHLTQVRKLNNKGRAFIAASAVLTTLVGTGISAPVANADSLQFPAYTLQVAAEGSNPVAPRFFEGFSSTVNVAGSETAEYALEQVGPCTTMPGSSVATRTVTSGRVSRAPAGSCLLPTPTTTMTTTS